MDPDRTQQMAGLLAGLPDAPAIEDLGPVRILPNRELYRGMLDGKPVFLKRLINPGPNRVARIVEELEEKAIWMSEGDFRVNPLIFASEREGIVVLGAAPGQILFDMMAPVGSDIRRDQIASAGRWLRAFIGPTLHHGRHVDRQWPARWDTDVTAPLFGRDAELSDKLIAELAGQRADLALQPLAKIHGDFAPTNLMVDGRRITGIDINGRGPLPVARDFARFLVFLALRAEGAAFNRHGVIEADQAALLEGFGTSEADHPGLRFFIGDDLYRRLRLAKWPRQGRRRSRDAILAYLA